MRRNNLDLLLALGIAMVNVVWVLLAMLADLTAFSVVNIILTLPLVFVIPGYTLTETFFARRPLEPVQRLAFTLALSLSIAIISGFLLNLLPTGLTLLPWASWLGLLSMIFAVLAVIRRRGQSEGGEQSIIQNRPQRFRTQISAVMLFAMSALVIVLSMMYSVIGAEQRSQPTFNQLSALPSAAGNTCAVVIRLQSFEANSTSFGLTVTANRALISTWSTITLLPQQEWIYTEPLPVETNNSLLVLVQLYHTGNLQTRLTYVQVTLHVVRKGTSVQCTYA
jgi:hypothetical protein